VQYLANLKVDKNATDPRLTAYLEENIPKMRGFLELVCDYPKDAYFPDMSGYIDLERWEPSPSFATKTTTTTTTTTNPFFLCVQRTGLVLPPPGQSQRGGV